jgi:hypothetical protein
MARTRRLKDNLLHSNEKEVNGSIAIKIGNNYKATRQLEDRRGRVAINTYSVTRKVTAAVFEHANRRQDSPARSVDCGSASSVFCDRGGVEGR